MTCGCFCLVGSPLRFGGYVAGCRLSLGGWRCLRLGLRAVCCPTRDLVRSRRSRLFRFLPVACNLFLSRFQSLLSVRRFRLIVLCGSGLFPNGDDLLGTGNSLVSLEPPPAKMRSTP